MSTLAFFPWLEFKSRVVIGNWELIPYKKNNSDFDEAVQSKINDVIKPYYVAPDRRITEVTLLKPTDKELFQEFTEEQRSKAFEMKELLGFSALDSRRFFNQFDYINISSFLLYVQNFEPPFDSYSIEARRRDGYSRNIVFSEDHMNLKPLHIQNPAGGFEPDIDFLEAMLAASEEAFWGNIWEGIMWFNKANTDSRELRKEEEILMAVGAIHRFFEEFQEDPLVEEFQKLIDSQPEIDEEVIDPSECERITSSEKFQEREKLQHCNSVKEVWIRDFHQIRGDYAHGRFDSSGQDSIWNDKEHLLLASYLYPKLVKKKLAREGFYQLKEDDRITLETFGRFSCMNIFGKNNEGGWNWKEREEELSSRKFSKAARQALEEVNADESEK